MESDLVMPSTAHPPAFLGDYKQALLRKPNNPVVIAGLRVFQKHWEFSMGLPHVTLRCTAKIFAYSQKTGFRTKPKAGIGITWWNKKNICAMSGQKINNLNQRTHLTCCKKVVKRRVFHDYLNDCRKKFPEKKPRCPLCKSANKLQTMW